MTKERLIEIIAGHICPVENLYQNKQEFIRSGGFDKTLTVDIFADDYAVVADAILAELQKERIHDRACDYPGCHHARRHHEPDCIFCNCPEFD